MSGIFKDKKIPAVAITSLVFGGACDSESLGRKACENLQNCEPEEFGYMFDSMSECVDMMEARYDEMEEYMSMYYSTRCVNAHMDIRECRLDDMADCEYDYGSCDHLYSRIYDACDYW